MTLTAYVAAPGFERDLIQDLERAGVPAEHIGTRLFLTDSHPVFAPWAANVWFDVQRVHIASIKDGARQLREMQRNWVLHEDGVGEGVHRRARLIADGLPHVSGKPIRFPNGQPKSPLGSWTLVDASTMLAATRCSSPVGDGAFMFAEDREGPPSRAYLKLWEALTRIDFYPGTGTHCVDLGAAPGGWSWVLAELGAQVTAVDKAPLDPSLVARDSVQFLQESAFGLSPEAYIERHGRVDLLCSDIICYPDRMIDLAERWQATGHVAQMICTLKFQGATDFDAIDRTAQIPGSEIIHLHHNKHELTWFWSRINP